MKPLERVTRHCTLRAGIIVCGAIVVLALSSLRAGVIAARAPTSAGSDVKPAAHSAKEIRGASPYIELENEPPPRLIVDPPLPNLLNEGVVWIQWRVENVHIVPVFGKGALNVSPRAGHLHVHVDDLPWWWADASDINTIDLAGMPPGPHKIRIELVNPNHEVFPGQSRTVTFTIPKGTSHHHQGHGRVAANPERPKPRERE
jgi:hypothetical protein